MHSKKHKGKGIPVWRKHFSSTDAKIFSRMKNLMNDLNIITEHSNKNIHDIITLLDNLCNEKNRRTLSTICDYVRKHRKTITSTVKEM